MPREISFTVPLVPPSVNHYKKPRMGGRGYYLADKALAFFKAVAVFGRDYQLKADSYEVCIAIFLGKRGKGDADNFGKVVLDGLVRACVIHSDAAVRKVTIEKDRDWNNPRTEITVRAL